MNPWLLVLAAFCAVPVFYAYVAMYQLAAARIRDRRAKRAACRDRHPAGREMPPDFAAWLQDEIAGEVARREADRMFAELEAWRRGE